MKNLSNWVLSWLHKKELQEQPDYPYIVKLETDDLKTRCILEIVNEIEPLWLDVKNGEYKLGIKTIQNNRARIERNDNSNTEKVARNPVFSEDQIAVLKSKFWLQRFVIIAFCIAESFLYTLIASLFVPGGGLYLQIPVAIFLAVLIMLALDYAMEKHFTYRDMVAHHNGKENGGAELKKHKDLKTIGHVIIALCIAAIAFAGLSRVFFMEYIPLKGLTPERIKSVTNASKMASIFTMLVTFIAAIFMAMIKRDQSKIGIRFRVYQSWHKAHVQRNIYTQLLIKNANKIVFVVEAAIKTYWQLVNDLKRALHKNTECDAKYQAADTEFTALIAKPDFQLNDHLYRRFECIQCMYGEIFEFGILNSKELKPKLAYILEILKVPEEHLAEHLASIANHKVEPTHTIILPATNGQLKKV